MTQLAQTWLVPICTAFELPEVSQIELLTSGLLHQTWLLTSAQDQYIAQKMHPIFDGRVTEDAQAISSYLRQHDFSVPEFLMTAHGQLHLTLEGHLWRVMPKLAGTTHPTAPSVYYIEQAGRTTGLFHRLLADFPYQFKFQLAHFHDTAYIFEQLQTYADRAEIAPELDFFAQTVPQLYLPTLPQHLIHGDLKLANFLFTDSGTVSGLVDLDTLMQQSLCVELGDAFRSWCTVGQTFSLSAFQAGLTGYAATGQLGTQEVDQLLAGIKLITLELGMRYLQDVIEQNYFQWDAQAYPSAAAHHRARARRQIAVYQDIRRQEAQLEQVIALLYPDSMK